MKNKIFHDRKGDWLRRKKVFVCVTNKNYGEKLARFMVGKHNPDIDVELLTEIRDEMRFEEQDYVLTDVAEIRKVNCHILQLGKTPEEEGENKIFMYQNREKIYQEVLEKMGETLYTEAGETENNNKLICVFSPEGGDEKTLLALRMAAKLSQKKRVLYVSLCGFPVFGKEQFGESLGKEKKRGHSGIAELILYAQGDGFEKKLEEMAMPWETIFMMAPVAHYRDLLDFSLTDVKSLVQGLREQSKFDAVVLEMGQIFEYTLCLLEEADKVLVPREDGFFAAVKRHVLQQYCIMEGKQDLWERMCFEKVKMKIPKNEEEIKSLIKQESGVEEIEESGK